MTWDMALRQLSYRWRQNLLAILGTALVFATALLAAGMSAGFHAEAARTLAGVGGDGWVIAAGTTSPFSAEVALDQGQVNAVARDPGVKAAAPILILNESVAQSGHLSDAIAIGHPLGTAEPPVVAGRSEAAASELIADRSAGLALGATVTLAGRPFHVVGLTNGRTLLAGTPTVYLPLRDAQDAGAAGAAVVSAVVVTGEPTHVASGLRWLDRGALTSSILRPLHTAQSSIAASQGLLWLVAVVIVGCVTYMAAIEQVREFAVLKAIGAASRSIAVGLCAQAVLVTIIGGGLALVLSRLLRPGLGAFPVEFTAQAQALVPAVAVVVGMLASVGGIRRVLRADPSLAFAGGG